MKKLLSICLLFILISFVGCSKQENNEVLDYPRPIDIISIEPLITCTSNGNEECLITIKNYTNEIIENYSIELTNKGTSKFITGISFNKEILPNSEIDIIVILPDKYSLDDVDMNITNYK